MYDYAKARLWRFLLKATHKNLIILVTYLIFLNKFETVCFKIIILLKYILSFLTGFRVLAV